MRNVFGFLIIFGLIGIILIISSTQNKTKTLPINQKLIESGLFTEAQIFEKLNVNSSEQQPLIRLLVDPETFYERKVVTIGFFRMQTQKFGFLYLNKEEANVMNLFSRVSLGDYLDMDEKVDLKRFDYRYIIVSGTFSNRGGELVIYNIDKVWDFVEFQEATYGEFVGGKFKNYLEKKSEKKP